MSKIHNLELKQIGARLVVRSREYGLLVGNVHLSAIIKRLNDGCDVCEDSYAQLSSEQSSVRECGVAVHAGPEVGCVIYPREVHGFTQKTVVYGAAI